MYEAFQALCSSWNSKTYKSCDRLCHVLFTGTEDASAVIHQLYLKRNASASTRRCCHTRDRWAVEPSAQRELFVNVEMRRLETPTDLCTNLLRLNCINKSTAAAANLTKILSAVCQQYSQFAWEAALHAVLLLCQFTNRNDSILSVLCQRRLYAEGDYWACPLPSLNFGGHTLSPTSRVLLSSSL